MSLRPATPDDARALWEWRNDPATRQNSFDGSSIEWEVHRAWLDRTLASPDCRVWILENDGCGVGQVRYERVAGTAAIHFTVAPHCRGQGFGTRLLELSGQRACQELGVSRVFGVVKDQNQPSQKAFVRAGFTKVSSFSRDGQLCWKFELECAD